jgi:predicted SnoaL-like aldol condensation-catalyzing enzyme
MHRRTVLTLLALAAAAPPVLGHAAAVRPEDRNREIVLAWYAALAAGDADRAAAAMAADYIEHGATMGSGAAGLRAWAQARDLVRNPFRPEVLHTIAQGDMVAVFLHSDFPGQGELGYMDFYRLKDGKLAEHWGFTQKPPAQLLHTNGFITRPQPTDRSKIGRDEARNLQGALGWFYDVLGKGDVDHSSVVQQDDYIQHAQGVATGNAGFRAFAKARDLPNNPFKVTVLKTVAEGDYIVTLGVGDIGGRQMAMPDWIRMKDGKLQEHWGLVQLVPAELPHANGFLGGLAPVR